MPSIFKPEIGILPAGFSAIYWDVAHGRQRSHKRYRIDLRGSPAIALEEAGLPKGTSLPDRRLHNIIQ